MTDTPQNGPRPLIPIEHAGKWLAYSNDETRLLAAERTGPEALDAARKAGEPDPVLVKAPPADKLFIG